MENIFDLSTEELKDIANELQERIEEGLSFDNKEILAIPTFISPQLNIGNERVLAIDWGGTNFRAAIIEFKDGVTTVIEKIKKRPLSKVETKGFNQEKLHEKIADYLGELKNLDNQVTKIGYCFSYPAASRLKGDAVLLRWTKGIDIPDMIDKPVGESLLKYLNNHNKIRTTFTEIKVINDTVACLFSGLTELTPNNKPYDSYIGLIVGTGTNMASLVAMDKIEKLNLKVSNVIPVNMESGNFHPSHLTVIDDLVDALSENKSCQRFEKAVSGGYLGQLFKTTFMEEKIISDIDGKDLSNILNNPTQYKQEHVAVANWIYSRSARLVASSIVGLIQVLVKHNKLTKNIYIAADGSVFWSNDFKCQVEYVLKDLLPQDVFVKISDKKMMQDPNLTGAAIAALS